MTVDEIDNDFIHTINRDYNYVTQNSPVVPQAIWDTARNNLKEIDYWDTKFSDLIGGNCGFNPSDFEQK